MGHPTYGLSVVLFALLLSAGLGSYLTRKMGSRDLTPARAGLRLMPLLFALVLFGTLTPPVVVAFQAATTIVRIVLATVVSLFAGISASFWTGFVCYATACAALALAARALSAPATLPEVGPIATGEITKAHTAH